VFARIRSSKGAGVFGELLMLVVGINIALWFEGKFEEFREAETEQLYLQGLHDDLTTDLQGLERVVAFHSAKLERLESIITQLPSIDTAPAEEIAAAMFEPSGYDFFQASDFTYRSMQDSGDFRLLSDPQLKRDILKLARQYRLIEALQQNFMQALDDEYIPLMMRSFDIVQMRLSDPSIIDNQVFRNFFVFTMQDIQGRVRAYEAARQQVETLLAQIGAQIDTPT
jgi:hypothetical protein